MKRVWVDLFEKPRLSGRCRRLLGPGFYKNLRRLTDPLQMRIASLAAGPEAYVRLFDSDESAETIWWMRPGTIVASIANIPGGAQIDGIELSNQPPCAGEAGFEFYNTVEPRTAGEN